ncbi:MAG: RluA family pseudouridine synthase [Candidatus Peribacteraceae bacterium]|nr:RluA family pseudouridine synthase [Candidatus Peribacteraceae bacterium]
MDWLVSLPDRLDSFLAADGRMLSRTKAQKAIEDGQVSVNDDVVTKPAHRLQEGDQVSVDSPAPASDEESKITPADLHLTVLYEDSACFVIDKPAGVAVHPGAGMAPGEVTLLHGISFLFKKKKIPFTSDSVLVHRLDKDTTGCVLVAKTAAAHLFLQQQFETRTVKKKYLALVAGIPKVSEATVDAPIGRSVNNRTEMTVFHSARTRAAQTTYRVLDSAGKASLLECDLHTGRTHQVRVHLSSIGHPVLGDSTYTSLLSERLMQEFDIRSLCLHAWKLAFTSPADKKEHAVEAEVPQNFLRAKDAAGIEWKQK